MPFSRTRPIVAGLALSLLCAAASFAQAPAAPIKGGAAPSAHPPTASVTAPPSGYHWRTLVLQHAVPSDILQMMHWDSAAAPPALPAGVRRVFALQSNNSLLLEATEGGFATAASLVKALDIAPRSVLDVAPGDVRVDMMLVVVPEARAGLYTPDVPASKLLPRLLASGARTVAVPTITITNRATATLRLAYDPPPVRRFQLVQRSGAVSPVEARLTPRINADGTVTLGLTFAGRAPSVGSRTARAGESVVYDISGPLGGRGERVFLFARPTITDSVTVTP